MNRFITYITKPRPYDTETAMHIFSGTGGILGTLIGIKDAYSHNSGYICRPVMYGSTGAAVGLLAGIHYRKTMMAFILYDVYKLVIDKKLI